MNLLIFLILALIACGDCIEQNPCCDDENINIVIGKDCLSNSKKIILPHCVSKSFADPEVDEIEVLSNGDLLIDDFVTSKSDYCSANFTWDNETTASFGYIFCFEIAEPNNVMYMVKGFLMGFSDLFLLLTLHIYHVIPDLRQTLDKVTAFSVLSLLLFMTALSMVQFQFFVSLTVFCHVIAYCMYFFAIAYFVWLQVIMINIWKLTTGRHWAIKERTWYATNHFYVWSMTSIWTIAVYFYDKKYKSIGVVSCWFRTNEEQEIFVYLPLLITIIINVVLYIRIIYYLNVSGSGISPDRKKVLKYKCMLYLKLFLISGLIWLSEILSFKLGHITPIVWIIVDCMNCLHGVLVFIVLIIWRQRIKRELAGKRVLCYTCPSRWAEIEDDEQETLNEEDAATYDLIVQHRLMDGQKYGWTVS